MQQYAKYLRKSRFDRDYAELSVEETLRRHEAILDKLAESCGYCITKTYYEVVSGESIVARPEIQKLLEEVGRGVYAGVLVVDLERLARGNSLDQAYISQVFQLTGTKIITPMKVYDPSNEFDEEYFEFGLFMSRREYKTIVRRMVRGRESSASEGKYLGSIPPYGYTRIKLENEKGYTLEPDPDEAPYVQKIFELAVGGAGTKVIANYLNEHGVKTRHGDLWTYCTISNILTNPVYTGKIRRGWLHQIRVIENGQIVKKTRERTSPSEYRLYDGLHPALVSEEDYAAAQQVREGNMTAPKTKRNTELSNAFAGLIFCADCGKRIARTTTAAPYKRARFRCVNSPNCKNSSANYEVVEGLIIQALEKWYDDYRVKVDTVGYADEIEELQRRIKKWESERSKLASQLETAFDLVEQKLYTREVFAARSEKLQNGIAELDQKIEASRGTIAKMEYSDQQRLSLIPQTERLFANYEQMTVRERNALLKEILVKIEYRKNQDKEIEIELYPRIPKE